MGGIGDFGVGEIDWGDLVESCGYCVGVDDHEYDCLQSVRQVRAGESDGEFSFAGEWVCEELGWESYREVFPMRDWRRGIVKLRCSEAFRALRLYNMRRGRMSG